MNANASQPQTSPALSRRSFIKSSSLAAAGAALRGPLAGLLRPLRLVQHLEPLGDELVPQRLLLEQLVERV